MATTTTTDTWTTDQVMMTLCTLCATSADPRPSGESLADQQARILAGINQQLTNPSLATQGQWQAVWMGLSVDRGNLACIVQGPSNTLAVCLRGTVAGSPIDKAEDMNVGLLMPFAYGGGNISQGAMEAFTEVTSSVYVGSLPLLGLAGKTLTEALGALVTTASAAPTIVITGHSLGGALATTIGLYLSNALPGPTYLLYTFAAPTAGDSDFATAVINAFGLSESSPTSACYYNYYDVVPYAWADLLKTENFFPKPGPQTNEVVIGILKDLDKRRCGNTYVQPYTQGQPASWELNSDFSVNLPLSGNTTEMWMQEVGTQHADSTYLTLLGVDQSQQPPNLVPTVASVSSSISTTTGLPTATITGTGFTVDSLVDFGTVPATSVAVVSNSQITATFAAFLGTVDVRVTNMFGTSAVASADWCSTPSS
jgi:acetyl esterase/lipase